MILLESRVLHDHVLRVLWTALFLYGLSLFLSGMVPSLLGIKSSGPWPHIGARFFSYTHAGKSAVAVARCRQKYWGFLEIPLPWRAPFLFLSEMFPSFLGIKSSPPWTHIGDHLFSHTHTGKSAGAVAGRSTGALVVDPKKSFVQELGFSKSAND